MKKISIIVPCYNEEQAIPYFYEEITKVAKEMKNDFEFIFVNDGSKDKTIEIVKEYAKKDKRVKFIHFSRNFGKEAAMYAGLELSTGDYVAIMDADLQDPPALLPQMVSILEDENSDYDSVGTRRVTRKGEPPIRSFFARKFYKIINKMSKIEMVDGARDYRLMKRQVVDSILSLNEYSRFSKGLFVWVGYKIEYLEYENIERVAGETKWSFWKLFRYALDGIIEYTNAPLEISFVFGGFLTFVTTIELIILLITSLCGKVITTATILISLILFIGGCILLAIGILGEYMAKTYSEVKGRPQYIVRKFYD